MRVRNNGALLAASVLVVTLVAHARSDPSYSELPNFHRVNVQLYRGAQPNTGGLQRLKAMGVKTVVNLRGKDEHTQAEADEAQKLGLRYYNVPLPGFSKPKDEDVQRALDIINGFENQPVFVHCHHGEDRTGTIIACYRISHDGWNAEQAKKEAKRYGMSWTQVGMKHYIDDYYARQQRKP